MTAEERFVLEREQHALEMAVAGFRDCLEMAPSGTPTARAVGILLPDLYRRMAMIAEALAEEGMM